MNFNIGDKVIYKGKETKIESINESYPTIRRLKGHAAHLMAYGGVGIIDYLAYTWELTPVSTVQDPDCGLYHDDDEAEGVDLGIDWDDLFSQIQEEPKRETIIDPLTGQELDAVTLIPIELVVDFTKTKIF
jgi:hypothetical protein